MPTLTQTARELEVSRKTLARFLHLVPVQWLGPRCVRVPRESVERLKRMFTHQPPARALPRVPYKSFSEMPDRSSHH